MWDGIWDLRKDCNMERVGMPHLHFQRLEDLGEATDVVASNLLGEECLGEPMHLSEVKRGTEKTTHWICTSHNTRGGDLRSEEGMYFEGDSLFAPKSSVVLCEWNRVMLPSADEHMWTGSSFMGADTTEAR
mmetsp:Transcript_10869/g.40549  ORF Transcript_10869/g.40549 Transcript_10869/m.40549 type:complete len:131 (-) Transcript_10869:267-659(-)